MTGEELDKINCKTGIYCNKLTRDAEGAITAKSKMKGEKNLLLKAIIPIPEQYYDNLVTENSNLTVKVNVNQTIGCYTLLNTHNRMNCADITIDGSLIVVGFKDGIIKMWVNDPDAITEISESLLKQMEQYIDEESGAFNYNKFVNARKDKSQNDYVNNNINNNTNTMYTGEEVNEKNVYDEIISRQKIFKLTGHSDSVFSVSISHDKKYIISGSYDETVRLWSIYTKDTLVIYKAHYSPVLTVKFSPLGYYIFKIL